MAPVVDMLVRFDQGHMAGPSSISELTLPACPQGTSHPRTSTRTENRTLMTCLFALASGASGPVVNGYCASDACLDSPADASASASASMRGMLESKRLPHAELRMLAKGKRTAQLHPEFDGEIIRDDMDLPNWPLKHDWE